MANAMMSWMLAVPLLGLTTGLRSMTPMAIICWFAHFGYLSVEGTWASWTAHPVAVAVFTVFAVGELIADKLPRTPSRISPVPLMARLVLGGLAGAIAATAMSGPGLEGALLGVAGAALGAYGGFMLRREMVEQIGCPDWPIAVAEDIFTVLCAIFAVNVVAS
jgi:uncharacterized membrane protein